MHPPTDRRRAGRSARAWAVGYGGGVIKPCFSTVAAAEWTFDRVCRFAAEHGFAGVECRTAGTGGGAGGDGFTSDPALTDGRKIRRFVDDHAIELASISTGVTFDRAIAPPVIGRVLPDAARDVLEARSIIDVAVLAGAELVRVYGFRMQGREKRLTAAIRIADRLSRAVDHTRHKTVRVMLENAGDFGRAEDLLELARLVDRPGLRFAYDPVYAASAGDDPVEGVRMLGGGLSLLRVRDRDRHGRPVRLGTGVQPMRDVVGAAGDLAHEVWVSTTWDRAWLAGEALEPAETAIAGDAETIYSWATRAGGSAATPAA